MKENKQHTPTELLVMVNSLKSKHETLKSEILFLLDEIEPTQNIINTKIESMKKIENEYVEIMELMTQIK